LITKPFRFYCITLKISVFIQIKKASAHKRQPYIIACWTSNHIHLRILTFAHSHDNAFQQSSINIIHRTQSAIPYKDLLDFINPEPGQNPGGKEIYKIYRFREHREQENKECVSLCKRSSAEKSVISVLSV
jgi:hypothetical protein